MALERLSPLDRSAVADEKALRSAFLGLHLGHVALLSSMSAGALAGLFGLPSLVIALRRRPTGG
jgi:hypothetical protein